MRSNNLFSKFKYGVINSRSTTLQLLYVLDELPEILDQDGTIDAVSLDFMKAFDKVPHERLLHKLPAYDISGHLHNWIRSFLTGRTQRVNVGSVTSEWMTLTSCILQGTVLWQYYLQYVLTTCQILSRMHLPPPCSQTACNFKEEWTHHMDPWNCKRTWIASLIGQMKFTPINCKVLSLGHRQ